MKLFHPNKFFSLGVVTAISFLGINGVAKADVIAGTDYVKTPGDGAIYEVTEQDIPGLPAPVIVSFTGVPIDPSSVLGVADTIIERKQDVTVEGGQTDIEIVALSLETTQPITVDGQTYKLVARLNPDKKSTGTMNIFDIDSTTGGTWNSEFTLNARVYLTKGHNFSPNSQYFDFSKTFTATNEPWLRNPNDAAATTIVDLNDTWTFDQGFGLPVITKGPNSQTANCHVPTANAPPVCSDQDFFVTEGNHDAGGGTVHNVVEAVPEPLTIFGTMTALGFGAVFKRVNAKKTKKA